MADVSTFEERQLLEQAQEWLEDADGHLQFHHMTVVYRVGSQLFRAIVKSRLPAELIKDTLAELHGTPFSLNDVLPIYPSHLKRALDASAMGWFVKQPRLLDIAADGGTRHVKELLLHEASIYEILESSPHPNVGRYHGCLVRDGRITGLCLTKYEVTLHDEIARTKQPFDPVPILEGIQSGLKHLHDLSLVHNDINPHNVMFAAGDDRPVIIDFDSCRRTGDRLGIKAGTPQWENPDAVRSLPENDSYGLKLLEVFINTVVESDHDSNPISSNLHQSA